MTIERKLHIVSSQKSPERSVVNRRRLCLVDTNPNRSTQIIGKYCILIVEEGGEVDIDEVIRAIRSLSPIQVLEMIRELMIISKMSTNAEIQQEARMKINQNELNFE